jgi:hypothetical protein
MMRQVPQQVRGQFGQQRGRGLVIRRCIAVERDRQAPRCRRRRVPGAGEGEELQQIAGGHGRQAKPLPAGGGVDQQGRRQVPQPTRDLGGRQGQQFPFRRQQRAAAEASDERGRFGEQQAGLMGRSRGAGLGHAGNLAPLCRRTKREKNSLPSPARGGG